MEASEQRNPVTTRFRRALLRLPVRDKILSLNPQEKRALEVRIRAQELSDRARGDQGPGNRVLDHRQAFLVLQKIRNKLFHFRYLKCGVVNVIPFSLRQSPDS